MKFYKRTIFWDGVRNSLALAGPSGGILVGKLMDDPYWIGVGIACALIAGLISIWFVDHDKNGLIDLFEEENPKK